MSLIAGSINQKTKQKANVIENGRLLLASA